MEDYLSPFPIPIVFVVVVEEFQNIRDIQMTMSGMENTKIPFKNEK